MKIIEFQKEFITGNAKIDLQHEKILQLISTFYEILGTKESRAQTINFLIMINEYTTKHFSDEEQFMQSMEYPYFEAHKKAHEEISKKSADMLEEYKAGTLSHSVELALFIRQNISEQIVKHDIHFTEWLQERYEKNTKK